jgi:hypothetical protein
MIPITPTIIIIALINSIIPESNTKTANEQKNIIQEIIMYFVFLVILPVSRYFFAPAARYLLLISQLYSRGEDLANAHNEIRTKTVVGRPGTNIPIAPRATHITPSPIQQIFLIFAIIIF